MCQVLPVGVIISIFRLINAVFFSLILLTFFPNINRIIASRVANRKIAIIYLTWFHIFQSIMKFSAPRNAVSGNRKYQLSPR